jgi:hypothetical protein
MTYFQKMFHGQQTHLSGRYERLKTGITLFWVELPFESLILCVFYKIQMK